jgi:cyclase
MPTVRVIPRLDIKGPNLVKGIHLEGLRVLGRPEDFASFYYQHGADELIYQDVVASLYERNSLHDFISRTVKDIFIPLTVGGGLRSLEDISAVLSAGADKVAINTAAIRNPKLISEAALRFGASTIVVAIESIRQPDGTWQAYTDNGREYTDAVSIPVIAHGGPGNVSHVADVIQSTGVDAVAIASLLHYDAVRQLDRAEEESGEGNTEFLRSGRGVSRIQAVGLPRLKDSLAGCAIDVRPQVTSV